MYQMSKSGQHQDYMLAMVFTAMTDRDTSTLARDMLIRLSQLRDVDRDGYDRL